MVASGAHAKSYPKWEKGLKEKKAEAPKEEAVVVVATADKNFTDEVGFRHS